MNTNREIYEEVFNYLDEADVVHCLQNLIRAPSDNPPANYSKIELALRKEMENAGLKIEVIGKPGKPNVIGTLKGSVGKPKVVFEAHLDTVAVGDRSVWKHDPFGGELEDGKIFGRGANDCKAPIASYIMAAKAINDAGIKLKGDIIIAAMCDEETGYKDGLWYLAEKGFFDDKAVLIGSGTTPFTHTAATRGVLWVELTTSGPGGHAVGYGHKKRPINALYKMVDVLEAIRNVDDWMTYEPHPLFTPEKGNTWTGKPIMEPTVINASSKINIIPEICKVQIDMRILPTQTCAGVLKDLENLLEKLKKKDPELIVDIRTIQAVDGRFIKSDLRDIELMKNAAKILGQQYKENVMGATLGTGPEHERLEKGKRRLSVGTMTEEILSTHGPDEYQLVSNLMLATKTSALYALEFCGVMN